MVMYHHQNTGQNHNLLTWINPLKMLQSSDIWEKH
jgi:hypothetical protein